MRTIAVAFATLLLAGCTKGPTVLVNDRGDRITCEVTVFGFAGWVMSDSKYQECIADAKARGYRPEEPKN